MHSKHELIKHHLDVCCWSANVQGIATVVSCRLRVGLFQGEIQQKGLERVLQDAEQ